MADVWAMNWETIDMTTHLAMLVWQNTNKLAGLVEGGGVGRKRFWACMYMFMKEGLMKGGVDTYVAAHSCDERWEALKGWQTR